MANDGRCLFLDDARAGSKVAAAQEGEGSGSDALMESFKGMSMPARRWIGGVRAKRWSRRRRGAFTLTEVLLALAITTVVGLAVVAMLSAAAYGSNSRSGMRELFVLGRTTVARVGQAIRTAAEVVEVDGTAGAYIVLWTADINADGAKQHGEMQLIERDALTNELRSFTNPADSTTFASAAAFRAVAQATFTSERWATGITAATFTQVAPQGGGTTLVSYRITATRSDISETSVGAVAVRNAPAAP